MLQIVALALAQAAPALLAAAELRERSAASASRELGKPDQ
jgi:hypothetical protein